MTTSDETKDTGAPVTEDEARGERPAPMEDESGAHEVRIGGPDGAEPESMIAIPDELPVLPIRNAVAFPGTIIPLTVSREKSKR